MSQLRIIPLVLAPAFMALTGCQSVPMPWQDSHQATEQVRTVNQARWQKSDAQSNILQKIQQNLLDNQSLLVFIRQPDQNDRFSSTNIGVDGRFQVSLQGGYYSELVTCSGKHALSAQITGNQSNDLDIQAQSYQFAAKNTYYFLVTPATQNSAASIQPITTEQGMQLLQNSQRQAHQIGRVVSQCPNT